MSRLAVRTRLTISYSAILIAALAAFGADLWWVEGRLGLRRVDRELDALAITVTLQMSDELRQKASLGDAAREALRFAEAGGHALSVADEAGRPIVATRDAARWPVARDEAPEGSRTILVTPGGAWRIRSAPAMVHGRPIRLAVGAPMRDATRQQHEVLETLWLAIPIALLIAGGGGFWIATRSLQPIEKALRMQRQFMADASHELRTPVSIVRTASDVALSAPVRSADEYRETLSIVRGQSIRLSRVVENMMFLARADAGAFPVRRVELYLDEILADCCRAVDVLCRERRVTIEHGIWPETRFDGDEDLLRQMLVNVLQNAVQWTRACESVRVDLMRSDRAVIIAIADHGPGVPARDRARIFERFVRLDPARTGGGAGLGLPIARRIAEAHGGSLTLAGSGAEGSTFMFTLPADPPALP